MFRLYRAGISLTLVMASLAASLISTGPVTAATGALCYTLAVKDCQILSKAEANVITEKSFQADFDFSGSLILSTGTGTATSHGSLILSYDPTLLNDSTALFQKLQGKMDVSGALSSVGAQPPLNQKGTLNFVAVNGIFYRNSSPSGWTGYSIDQQIQAFSDGFQSSFQNGFNQSGNSTSTKVLLDFLQDPSVPALISALPSISGFIKLTKTANTPLLDGQKQTEFVYTYDLPTLIKSKEMRPVFRALLVASGSSTKLNDTQLLTVGAILSRLFTGTTITLTRWVGTKDMDFHAVIIDATIKYDPSTIASLLPRNTGNLGAGGSIKVHVAAKLTKLNQPIPAITPPAGAILITPTALPTDAANVPPSSIETPTRTPMPNDGVPSNNGSSVLDYVKTPIGTPTS